MERQKESATESGTLGRSVSQEKTNVSGLRCLAWTAEWAICREPPVTKPNDLRFPQLADVIGVFLNLGLRMALLRAAFGQQQPLND